MKPRVLLVSHTYTARVNRAKLDALAQHVSLTVIVPGRWRDPLFTVDAAALDTVPAYSLYALPIRFNGHILRYVYPFGALGRILGAVCPDLIQVEEEPASFVVTQLALRKRKSKLIFFSWENTSGRASLPLLEGWNLSRSDGAICGNQDARALLRSKEFAKPIAVIPQLGVDTQLFRPQRSEDVRNSLGLNVFVVGYVGRLVEEKGLWTLLRAIECLPQVGLLMIGSGPLRDTIERWVVSRSLTERVRIVDAALHQHIPRYLNGLDALALPSQTTPRWKEQFGHVLIEAMACGVPVIGSDSGAIPEVIGDAGIVFPEGNADALREAICALEADSVRREQLGKAGRARVLSFYTHERVAAQTADFFQQVLAA